MIIATIAMAVLLLTGVADDHDEAAHRAEHVAGAIMSCVEGGSETGPAACVGKGEAWCVGEATESRRADIAACARLEREAWERLVGEALTYVAACITDQDRRGRLTGSQEAWIQLRDARLAAPEGPEFSGAGRSLAIDRLAARLSAERMAVLKRVQAETAPGAEEEGEAVAAAWPPLSEADADALVRGCVATAPAAGCVGRVEEACLAQDSLGSGARAICSGEESAAWLRVVEARTEALATARPGERGRIVQAQTTWLARTKAAADRAARAERLDDVRPYVRNTTTSRLAATRLTELRR